MAILKIPLIHLQIQNEVKFSSSENGTRIVLLTVSYHNSHLQLFRYIYGKGEYPTENEKLTANGTR